jgi:hypothetical protein
LQKHNPAHIFYFSWTNLFNSPSAARRPHTRIMNGNRDGDHTMRVCTTIYLSFHLGFVLKLSSMALPSLPCESIPLGKDRRATIYHEMC